MPDLDALALRALMDGGVFQYPDKRLYQAAMMLTPEERPTVPVRMIDPDPSKNYIFKVRPNTNGITDRFKTIYIADRKDNSAQSDPAWIASIMAHEAEHVNRGDYEERPAYEKQEQTLKRLHYKGPYLKALEQMKTQR
jgi:hypothetical protein